jgi:hypothetical protein
MHGLVFETEQLMVSYHSVYIIGIILVSVANSKHASIASYLKLYGHDRKGNRY